MTSEKERMTYRDAIYLKKRNESEMDIDRQSASRLTKLPILWWCYYFVFPINNLLRNDWDWHTNWLHEWTAIERKYFMNKWLSYNKSKWPRRCAVMGWRDGPRMWVHAYVREGVWVWGRSSVIELLPHLKIKRYGAASYFE